MNKTRIRVVILIDFDNHYVYRNLNKLYDALNTVGISFNIINRPDSVISCNNAILVVDKKYQDYAESICNYSHPLLVVCNTNEISNLSDEYGNIIKCAEISTLNSDIIDNIFVK
jgi:hypothetical protein